MSARTVFLSCRDEDAPRAESVRRVLESAHLRAVAGRDAIAGADWFITCVSANGYVAEELDLAIATIRRLEHDPSWLLVVRLEPCNVPPLPVTSEITLRDLVVGLEEIPLRLAPRQSRASVVTETETQRLMASRGVIIGTQVTEPVSEDLHSKTTFGDVVIDHEVTFIGTVIGKHRGNKP